MAARPSNLLRLFEHVAGDLAGRQRTKTAAGRIVIGPTDRTRQSGQVDPELQQILRGHSAEESLEAVEGRVASPYHMGKSQPPQIIVTDFIGRGIAPGSVELES